MVKWSKIFFFIILSNLLLGLKLDAQFYNGLDMDFGKNRVQYVDFYWSFYRFDNFDIYFNQYGKNLAKFSALYANDKIVEIENYFDYRLDKRLILIIYNKLTDFRQSNIGLITGEQSENLGGVTKILDNKIFLYYEGNHDLLKKQINEAIAEIVVTEMLIGDDVKDRTANLASLNLPDWYLKGLISYVSDEWNVKYDNKLKDGILSGKYSKFAKLTGDDAIIAGHSMWRYLSLTYGKSIIPGVFYLTRLNKNSNRGFFDVLGIRMRHLIKEWNDYYKTQYCEHYETAGDSENSKIIRKAKKPKVYQNISISPDDKFIAYSTNEWGKKIIWIYNVEKGRKKKIFKLGYKLVQKTDYTFPVMDWHPSGKILTFFTEEKGGMKLNLYNNETKKLVNKNFLYFEKVLSFDYSDNGFFIVLSGVKDGLTDVYVHNLTSSTNKQITMDLADDVNPRFVENSQKIIFSSNRKNDSLIHKVSINDELNEGYNLFICNYKNEHQKLIQLTNNKIINNLQAFETDPHNFIYLSDENGIQNRFAIKLDSAISYIDTAIHYSYTKSHKPISNYPVNIEYQYVNKKNVGEIIFKKKRNHVYFDELPNGEDVELENTWYRDYSFRKLARQDSIARLEEDETRKQVNELPDSIIEKLQDPEIFVKSKIDIRNYIFEIEKRYTFDDELNPILNTLEKNKIEDESDFPPIRVYRTAFYANYLVNQVDFGFMNASYQSYTGNGQYFNPGPNGMFKIGANDLFEDYKILGGIRLSSDLKSNEYLLSFENLKKRIDKQVIFHRQSLIEEIEALSDAKSKSYSNNLMFVFKYPYNQVKSFKVTFSGREDKIEFVSAENVNLLGKQSTYRYWTGIKIEQTFDNSLNLGVNLYNGTRYKLFAEMYKMLFVKKSDLFVLGVDFRHYQKIYHDMIFANRIAASTSFGGSRLLYYLGAVDNWLLPRRDSSIPVDDEVQYRFQANATNLRGFYQNARNGNSFIVFNNEIRVPLFRMLSPYPISNKFFSSFQFVGFFDIGTAWTGFSPYSGENEYDSEIIEKGNVKLIINSNRDPIIYGFGYGLRMQILSYFLRLDFAYGVDSKILLPRVFYISTSLDF